MTLEFSIVIHQKTQQNNKENFQIVMKNKTQIQFKENYMDSINNELNNGQEFKNSFAWTKHNASWAWDEITSSREVFANQCF